MVFKEPNPKNLEGITKILIIGSRKSVQTTIQQLHILKYAKADEWSTLQPAKNQGEFLSILVRRTAP